jgi:type IV secretory pathway VirB10-like protein
MVDESQSIDGDHEGEASTNERGQLNPRAENQNSLGEEPSISNELQYDAELEYSGVGRFNRLLLVVAIGIAMAVGVVAAQGIRSAGVPVLHAGTQAVDDGVDTARTKAEVEGLAASGEQHETPIAMPSVMALLPKVQTEAAPRQARTPSRYTQWAEDKYMKALEAPQMVPAFHDRSTLEIAQTGRDVGGRSLLQSLKDSNVILRPPASPYTVMAGNVIPAVLVSGINSDLPGPILAQVSENVFDSATGKSLLIPQGSRLIGVYRSATGLGQQRVQIAWQRLIFPNTASMDLPQMPGMDQAGYSGFSDKVNNHYAATFSTAAVMSLISAGQMVGQMAAFGGGGVYGPYGYYQPNQWAMAGETAGSAVSGQLGNVGQQMMGRGLSRSPTIEIRPGYQFEVMVTEDLVFPAPYGR